MFRLRFTTVVDAPATVAFDVARALDAPSGPPMSEVTSERPVHDVRVLDDGRRRVTHSRRFSATGAGTQVDDEVVAGCALPGVLGWITDRSLRRRLQRAMRAHLDAYAVAAERLALDVVQVVGAAVIDGDRVLVAQRSGGPFDGQWEFPGGKVEPGESDLAALVRECAEELGVGIRPEVFLGEALLDGVVGGGQPGTSTLRVWSARLAEGRPVAREHAELRWVGAAELEDLDWIRADRPLLPAVRRLLAP